MTPKLLPPLEELRQLFSYDPETGIVTFLATGTTGCKRRQASTKNPAGVFLYTKINGKKFCYAAHRIAYSLFHNMDLPVTLKVDHIDGWAWNNSITNLRLATHAQNICNAQKYRRIHEYPKGVSYNPRKPGHKKPWKAMITVEKKKVYLGRFTSPEEAHRAYCDAAVRFHGEYARFS